MPLETGTTIADLVSTNPAATDGLGQADDQIRLIKTVLKTTFPAFVGVLAASEAEIDASLALTQGIPWDTAQIADDAVTYAKIQNVSATDMLLGRSTAGAGNVEEIACTAAGRALLDDANAAAQRTTLGISTVGNTGAYADLTGKPTLGTAAALDVGTGASQVVQLNGSAQLPAVSGVNLTNIPYSSITGRDMVLLETQGLGAVAAAEVEFDASIDSTYRAYLFQFDFVAAGTAGQAFIAEISTDGGSTYASSNYQGGTYAASPGFALGNMTSATTYIQLATSVSTVVGQGLSGWMLLTAPATNGVYKRTQSQVVSQGGGLVTGAASINNTSPIDAVRFRFTSGNVADATITMYGIR
jgi:hypothetical protein